MANKKLKDFKAKLFANKDVRKAYDDLAPEYAVARTVIKARAMSRTYRHWFWHSRIINWLEGRTVKISNYIWRKRWSGKFRND